MTAESREIARITPPLLRLPLMGRVACAWRRLMAWLSQFGVHYRFTTISGRILALNFISVVFLVAGLLYLNNFRGDLITARMKSLEVQAEIIAQSIALNTTAQSTQNANAQNDPLAEMQQGAEADDFPLSKPYAIKPEQSAQLLRDLIRPTRTPGFIYNADGEWLADSNKIYTRGQLVRYQQPVRRADEMSAAYRLWLRVEEFIRGETLPLYKDHGLDGKAYAEVKSALEQGATTPMVRVNDLGETILSVAAPIRRGSSEGSPVLGALLLTTAPGEIDGTLVRDRVSLMWLMLLVLTVSTVFSLLLAGTIAGPMHRLARAAERVRKNIKIREEIPDFTHRSDEIGDLSRALREMTAALYQRLDAIESFAADVSHEIKNPLTSLSSAAGTLSIVKKPEDRERLVKVIMHDVQRLDRLITDISDASRLDAELAREIRHPVNLARLLDAICSVVNDIHRDGAAKVELRIIGAPREAAINSKALFTVSGHDSRLGQVFNNIIDNARSFSPRGGKIVITCSHHKKASEVEITFEDEGPGIPDENLEKIFERFYTYRPGADEFGKNSGLGLNICRQIVNAHKGRVWAENRLSQPVKSGIASAAAAETVLGARFTIRLPAIK